MDCAIGMRLGCNSICLSEIVNEYGIILVSLHRLDLWGRRECWSTSLYYAEKLCKEGREGVSIEVDFFRRIFKLGMEV